MLGHWILSIGDELRLPILVTVCRRLEKITSPGFGMEPKNKESGDVVEKKKIVSTIGC